MSALRISDVRVGHEFILGPYTVTRDEILDFARQFDPQPFHLDEAAATSSVLGGLAASGWHTASILMRLICDVFFLKVDTIGSTGIEEMKWLKPVYIDDVLSGSLKITGVRNSRKKPDRLIVNFAAELFDQRGTRKAAMCSMVILQVTAP